MTNNTDTAMNTATELLAERRKYEGWLAALHGRRESTPPHVFTRVLADYEARLEAVVNELKSKADALDARMAELQQRAAALQEDARVVQDERAEAELRAHVGELEHSAWETAASAADARLGALGQERAAVEKELASLGEMLGAARQPTPAHGSRAVERGSEVAAGGNAPIATGTSAGDDQDRTEAAAGGDAPIVTDSADGGRDDSGKPVRSTGSFDELAFLRDVAGEDEGAAAASPLAQLPPATVPLKPAASDEAASADPSAPPASAPDTRDHELELGLEPESPRTERPIKDTLGLVLPDERPALPSRRSSTEIPLAANVTGNTPIILETGGKQNKTLKCTDCGAMNYPTEWYCERCGAELSAL